MNEREKAFFFFRKLVFCVYSEIGALKPETHPELAGRAALTSAYFRGERKKQAAALYQQIAELEDTAGIIAPYQERTGLSLEEVRRAFKEGKWQNKFGGFNFGGPKWARIAEITLELQRAIEEEDWEKATDLSYEIKGLKTNFGLLIHEFDRTDRA